ncbi:hypothetical protein E2C01_020900 [Portunus trituberculatus]|uniref:Uncharacterized protein n=1 Tax=Portunus trituberculatus TaxID=210409 RepID=A0A5B7E150_PORTR|nr:hypothetical protein [Portunus trituberculatus]
MLSHDLLFLLLSLHLLYHIIILTFNAHHYPISPSLETTPLRSPLDLCRLASERFRQQALRRALRERD